MYSDTLKINILEVWRRQTQQVGPTVGTERESEMVHRQTGQRIFNVFELDLLLIRSRSNLSTNESTSWAI